MNAVKLLNSRIRSDATLLKRVGKPSSHNLVFGQPGKMGAEKGAETSHGS